jgi:hypothetical protein
MDSKQEFDLENDRLLDKLLKGEPGYLLPDDFADELVKKIRMQQSVKQNSVEFLTIVGAVIGLLLVFGGTYYFLNKDSFGMIKSFLLNGYTPIVALIVMFVYFMDKVMLKLLDESKS